MSAKAATSSSDQQQQQAALAQSALTQAAQNAKKDEKPKRDLKHLRTFGKLFALLFTVYSLGWLRMSMWWIVVVCLSYIYAEWRQRQRLNKLDKINFQRDMHYGDALRSCLRDQIPVWITFPDVEKAKWLADMLSDLWPMVKVATETSMMQSLTPIFDAACPAFLSSIKIHTLDLGDMSPTIPGVKVHDNNPDEIMLDIELKFAGNPKIALEAKASLVGVVVKLANLKVIGTLRIVLKPLVGQWPCFSVLSVSFKHKPQIEFSLETGKVNMMSIPGLSKFINSLIKDNIAFYLVWPKKIIIPILKVSDQVMAQLNDTEPKGILQITLMSCRDLDKSRGLGKLNPYVKMILNETKHKSSTKKDTTAPEWNEEFECLIHDLSTEQLRLSVRDHNEASLGLPATLLGEAVVSLDQLREKNDVTVWIPLSNCSKGEIQLRLHFQPFQCDKSSESAPTLRRRGSALSTKSRYDDPEMKEARTTTMKEPLKEPRASGSKAYLCVEVIRAENLNKTDWLGKSDPYVNLTIGKIKQHTKTINNTFNPVWNEKFNLPVANPESSYLQVDVKDQDRFGKDASLGELNLNLLDIASKCSKAKLTKTYELQNTKSGTITLGLMYYTI